MCNSNSETPWCPESTAWRIHPLLSCLPLGGHQLFRGQSGGLEQEKSQEKHLKQYKRLSTTFGLF